MLLLAAVNPVSAQSTETEQTEPEQTEPEQTVNGVAGLAR